MQILSSWRFGALALVSLALVACGSSTPGPSGSSSPTTTDPSASSSPSASTSPSPTVSIAPSADLSKVTVTDGQPPKVTVASPWAISSTTVKVLKEGTSPQVVGSGFVQVHYIGVNGRTGEVFDQNFDAAPISLSAPDGVVKGFATAVVGQKVGSRVLVGMPSSDGYPQGQGDKILAGDSLVFLIDIVAAEFGDVTGTMTQASGAPQVSVGASGPTVSVGSAARPTSTQSFALIEGTGPALTEGDTIKARFRSFTWDGKVFEDAWSQSQLGELSNAIPGFKAGLMGKRAGSRVLIVIPPDQAYPNGRTAQPTLSPGQTLIYVVDLFYAAKS